MTGAAPSVINKNYRGPILTEIVLCRVEIFSFCNHFLLILPSCLPRAIFGTKLSSHSLWALSDQGPMAGLSRCKAYIDFSRDRKIQQALTRESNKSFQVPAPWDSAANHNPLGFSSCPPSEIINQSINHLSSNDHQNGVKKSFSSLPPSWERKH